MERPTGICIRSAIVALLAILAAGCQAKSSRLGELYSNGHRELESGNLEVALTIAGRGLQRAETERDADWRRAFIVLQAEVLVAQRRIAAAIDRLNASLADKAPADVFQARGLMTRGYATCLSAGDNDNSRAELDLRDAARIAAALGAVELSIEVVQRRGNCYILRGDLEAAKTSFRDALAMAHTQGLSLREAQAAGSLGNLHIRRGEFDAATHWLRRSLSVTSAASAGGLHAKTLGNLGWCYYLLGDYERAVQVLSEAESLTRRLGYVGDLRIVLTNLGRSLYRLGDYVGAESSYREAAALAREIQEPAEAAEMRAGIHVSLATLALEQARHEEAAAQANKALRLYAELGYDIARQRTLLLQGEIWARRGEPMRAAALLRQVLGSTKTEPDVLWEARVALARQHVEANRPADAEDEFRRAFELMETSLAQLVEAENQLPFFATIDRFHDEYVDFLIAQGRVTKALEAADESRARLLQERLLSAGAAPAGPTSGIDYRSLARDLNVLLLFYWTAPERSFLWTVTADTVELVSLPKEETLEALVTAYQERIFKSRDPMREADPEGRELYRVLVRPVSAAMAAAERVVIVPDGPLHQINFETLVVPDPQPHYLIEDVTLERTPSLRLLSADATSTKREAPSLLVLGDPISPSSEFPPLPFARREITGIAELFAPGNRGIYSRRRANRAAYLSTDQIGRAHV